MTGLFKRCYNSQSRREQRSLERWEQEREQGIARYVLRQTMIFPVMMTVLNDVSGFVLDGSVPVFRTRSLVMYLLTGIVLSLFAWSHQEGKYKRTLRHRRRSLGDNKIVLR
jgi:hypothetical protein